MTTEDAKFACSVMDKEESIMEKKLKWEGIVEGAGKTAKSLLGHAVQAVDHNEDGKFDLADVAAFAETVGDAVKSGTQAVKDSVSEKARMHEKKSLQPIFAETLDDAAFLMPKFIRVTDRDKRYLESEVCQGSVGYTSNQKGLRIVNVFRDSVETFGITFYPDYDDEFYYVDPSDRNRYISLDEYFSHLKVARVNELQKIAQDLGAKHFRVTYKEEQISFSDRNAKGRTKAGSNKLGASADFEHDATERKYSTVEIAAEMECPGHEPVVPQLKYLQRDPSIQTLISMRMNEKTPLLHQKYVLKLSNSSGIKESDAIKIDAVLKGMKCSGNATVTSEAKNEARRYLEYDIEF